MTEFGQDLHHFKPSKESPALSTKMEVLNQFSEMTENILEGLNETEFSVEKFLGLHCQLPEYTAPSSNSEFPCVSLLKYQNELPVTSQSTLMADSTQETMKRKAIQVLENRTGNRNDSSNAMNLKNLQRGRKRRNHEKEQEKPAEIVHVRAKRGQATDSHSLAERVRREKINNKLKCLQNLIPGCHKTMGMAMVLDDTINYVHSLQNQVEFLSMELEAACSSLSLNFGRKALVLQQER